MNHWKPRMKRKLRLRMRYSLQMPKADRELWEKSPFFGKFTGHLSRRGGHVR